MALFLCIALRAERELFAMRGARPSIVRGVAANRRLRTPLSFRQTAIDALANRRERRQRK